LTCGNGLGRSSEGSRRNAPPTPPGRGSGGGAGGGIRASRRRLEAGRRFLIRSRTVRWTLRRPVSRRPQRACDGRAPRAGRRARPSIARMTARLATSRPAATCGPQCPNVAVTALGTGGALVAFGSSGAADGFAAGVAPSVAAATWEMYVQAVDARPRRGEPSGRLTSRQPRWVGGASSRSARQMMLHEPSCWRACSSRPAVRRWAPRCGRSGASSPALSARVGRSTRRSLSLPRSR
jgi:hypothetical protein